MLHDRAVGWADSSLKTPLQPGGINYTAIANRRDRAGSMWKDDLRKRINEALDKVASEVR